MKRIRGEVIGGFLAGIVFCLLIFGGALISEERAVARAQITAVIGSPYPLTPLGEDFPAGCLPSATPNDAPTASPTFPYTDIPGSSITPPPIGGGATETPTFTPSPTRRK